MSDKEHIQKMVDSFRDQLCEHCDSVRIFVTSQSQNGESETGSYTAGGGNLYAQLGQVQEWLQVQEEYVRVEARSKT